MLSELERQKQYVAANFMRFRRDWGLDHSARVLLVSVSMKLGAVTAQVDGIKQTHIS